MNRDTFLIPALLALLWVIMICFVNPIGNFPLNDDWQYARPVWFLINKGYYFAPEAFSPVIVVQVLWGSLFCLPFGFSFTALRFSTLVIGLAGILAFYFFVYHISKNKRISFIGALVLLINPLYFSLSNTFMTDVPFLAFALISMYFFYRSLEILRPGFLVTATIFAILATLIRQFGLVIPIAYSVVAIVKQKPKLNQLIVYFLPAITTIGVLELTVIWLKNIGSELHPDYGKPVEKILTNLPDIAFQAFHRTGILLFYTGFFLLPFTIFRGISFLKKLSLKRKLGASIFVIIFLPTLIIAWNKVPINNIISAGSIGPLTLRDEKHWFLPRAETIKHFSSMFSLLCFTGAILLLLNVVSVICMLYTRNKTQSEKIKINQFLFIFLCIFGYALLIFYSDFFFDRYLLVFTPLFFLFLCNGTIEYNIIKIPACIISFFLILLTMVFSVTGTHDYLAWNRSRWKAWNYALDTLKVSPHHIDGGYECNGWAIGQSYNSIINKQIDDNEYILSFGKIKGYALIKQFQYRNYFPYEIKNICILHRE